MGETVAFHTLQFPMLYAYRGDAFEHTHENVVFDELVKQAGLLWGDDERDVVHLFGNLSVRGTDLDALVVRRSAITIVEFKHYKGAVAFSENNLWTADHVPIKGGNELNPFRQVRNNKFRLLDFFKDLPWLPSERDQAYGHISGLVVFHAGPISFDEASVPQKIRSWFSVTDMDRAIERLDQIRSREINLSLADLTFIAKQLDVPRYVPVRERIALAARGEPAAVVTLGGPAEVEPAPRVDANQGLPVVPAPTSTLPDPPAAPSARVDWLLGFERFLESEDRTCLVTGSLAVDLAAVVDAIEAAAVARNRAVTILAPSARHAPSAASKGYAVSAYRYVYRGVPEEEGDRLVYGLAANQDADDQVYVVALAHLMGDQTFETDLIRFGSGRLLSDLVAYVDLEGSRRKVVWVGDPWQVPRGGVDDMATSPARLEALAGGAPVLIEVGPDGMASSAPGPVLNVAQNLVWALEAGRFHELAIQAAPPEIVVGPEDDGERARLVATEVRRDPWGTKVVRFAHRDVNAVNQWLRKTVFHRTGALQAGDHVQLHAALLIPDPSGLGTPQYLPNGAFLEVTSVAARASVVQPLKGRREPIEVRLIDVEARTAPHAAAVGFVALDGFVDLERPEAPNDVVLALRVHAAARFDADWARNPRSVNATSEARAAARRRFFADDPILNAARLRYGHALTLHRAQGECFDTAIVHFDTGQGQSNEAYFRWAYTALTLAGKRLIALSPPAFDPLTQAAWHAPAASPPIPKRKDLVPYDRTRDVGSLEGFAHPDLARLFVHLRSAATDVGAELELATRHPYQEVYVVRRPSEGVQGERRLHYDGRHRVTRMEAKGDASGNALVDAMWRAATPFMRPREEPRSAIHRALERRLGPVGFTIEGVEEHPNQELLHLSRDGRPAVVRVHYGAEGLASRVEACGWQDDQDVAALAGTFGSMP